MTNCDVPGNLFSIIIPGKNKPTKIYGILDTEKPTVIYGLLIEKDHVMNKINNKKNWWRVLLDDKIKSINIDNESYKTERHINEK